MNLELNNK
eukprot:gene18085-23733_t